MQAILSTMTIESTLQGATPKKRTLIAAIRRTAVAVGKTQTFQELTAIILAQSYQINGRKKDARNLLTSYLLHNPATICIVNALNANELT